MIQRLQSLFLFLAGLSFGLYFIVPLMTTPRPVVNLFGDVHYEVEDSVFLMVLVVAGIILTLINIFLYHKRKLQMRMVYVAILITVLIPICAFILLYQEIGDQIATLEVKDRLGVWLPIPSLLFLYLSHRYIRKDEKLVRSMDRLR